MSTSRRTPFRSITLTSNMGITIQQYRSRIGRFLPKNSSSNNECLESRNIHPVPYISGVWYMIVALAVFTPFTLALQQYQLLHHNDQTYSHPIYPTEDYSTSIHQLYNNNNYSGGTTSGVVFSFLMNQGVNMLASTSFSMITNFNSRYLYGNRRANGIKICHWNKGPGFLQNNVTEVKNIVNKLHPHIIGISEANLHQHHDQGLVQLEDYVLHISPTINNASLKTSRIVVYTHQ